MAIWCESPSMVAERRPLRLAIGKENGLVEIFDVDEEGDVELYAALERQEVDALAWATEPQVLLTLSDDV
eukprot:6239936-Amphidinium_carterae.1